MKARGRFFVVCRMYTNAILGSSKTVRRYEYVMHDHSVNEPMSLRVLLRSAIQTCRVERALQKTKLGLQARRVLCVSQLFNVLFIGVPYFFLLDKKLA